ncbi:unnamed protein product, partial [Callosobruchus maculatus]
MGIIKASFKQLGKIPCSMEQLIRYAKGWQISEAHRFNILLEISSYPQEFEFFNWDINEQTSSSETDGKYSELGHIVVLLTVNCLLNSLAAMWSGIFIPSLIIVIFLSLFLF